MDSVTSRKGLLDYLRNDEADVRRDLAQIYDLFPILGDRRWQEAGTLSGGEQQMCAIGRGIMSRPRLLMIDELSLGLAPKALEQLGEALVQIRRTRDLAILLVEQDVLAALELSDRAFVIDRGQVSFSGPADQVAQPRRCEKLIWVNSRILSRSSKHDDDE